MAYQFDQRVRSCENDVGHAVVEKSLAVATHIVGGLEDDQKYQYRIEGVCQQGRKVVEK